MTDFEVIALFTPADGQADAVHAALAALVAPSRAEPGRPRCWPSSPTRSAEARGADATSA